MSLFPWDRVFAGVVILATLFSGAFVVEQLANVSQTLAAAPVTETQQMSKR